MLRLLRLLWATPRSRLQRAEQGWQQQQLLHLGRAFQRGGRHHRKRKQLPNRQRRG